MNIVYVGISIGAIIVMGTIFGYYIIRIKTFDNIFAKMMKSDYTFLNILDYFFALPIINNNK